MSSVLGELTERVKVKAQEMMEEYDTAEHLMRDAIQGAYAWVPAFITSKRPPTSQQLIKLSAQLLAIAAATEADKRQRA